MSPHNSHTKQALLSSHPALQMRRLKHKRISENVDFEFGSQLSDKEPLLFKSTWNFLDLKGLSHSKPR